MSGETLINLWLGPMGVEASAHPSLEDALDDISSPGVDAKYHATLVSEVSGVWHEINLSAEASEYLDRILREWREEYKNIEGMRARHHAGVL